MTPSAPWSPTAHAFAQHQLSHVVNFWKQGRQASFRLEALPGGRAELNVTFQLPPSSEVVPPPCHPVPVHQRPIHPLFPGFSPQGPAPGRKTKQAPQKNFLPGSAKAFGALCFTGRPWLPLLYHPLRMVLCAKLLKPVCSACRLSQPPQ